MSETLMKAENLSRQFFRKGRDSARYFDAVSGVNLDLHEGEFIALVGRSGSGKSTLLNMLAGLLEPTEGHVEIDEVDLYGLGDTELSHLRNKTIGVIPQGQTPIHTLSVLENVSLPFLMYQADDGVESRAFELFNRLGIEHLADAYPRELSGGELRRMAIARALICEPKVVLADEPTADLDDETTRSVLSVLRNVADSGAAVLVVTHDQAVEAYADRVLHMDAGKITEM